MNVPHLKSWLFALLMLGSPAARAEDCSARISSIQAHIDEQVAKRDNDDTNEDDKKTYQKLIDNYQNQIVQAQNDCDSASRADATKAASLKKASDACDEKKAKYPNVYEWKNNKCVNKADAAASKSLPDNDDCSAASLFSGSLKGQNCKKAAAVVKDVSSRSSAITDATTAATTGYSALQATGATGNQDDAQTRQANIMRTLAFSKFATGIVNIMGASQLRNAASDAESASSTITGAQKNLQAACASDTTDDQACFYQHAAEYGVPADQASYASFERMKRGAQQSQDQADAANSLAKSSMITGAADMLTGMQAMQAAQLANTNAQAMAPMPFIAPRQAPVTAFGESSGGPSAPSLEQAASSPPTDYGTPTNNAGTFGDPHHGPVNGGMVAGKMGAPNTFKAASSGVSGGGGGGGVSAGGGSLRPGGGGASRPRGANRASTSGEFNLAGGGPGKGGGPAADKADANNPLADMLAKLFPQDQNGKTVVDARQIASAGGGVPEMQEQSDVVTPSDLSIFEQISSKYRQLNGDGRF